MVIGIRLELDQDLPDDTHARLAGDVAARQGGELSDHLSQQAPVAQPSAPGGAATLVLEELPDDRVPAFQEPVGGALLGLVGAHAQQTGVEGVADDDALDDLERQGRGDLEPGVLLKTLHGDREDGDLGVSGITQALAEHGGVVGGPAHPAGLRDGNHAAVGVVGAVLEGPDELADHHNGGEAGVIVDVAQAHLEIIPAGRLQQLDLVAQPPHERRERAEVDRAHLRHEDRVGGAHLLGERRGGSAGQLARPPRPGPTAPRAGALGLRAGRGTDGCGFGAFTSGVRRRPGGPGRGGGRQTGVDLDRLVLQRPRGGLRVRANRSRARTRGPRIRTARLPGPGGRSGIAMTTPGLGGRGQGSQADRGGPEIGDLIDLEGRVDASGGLQDLLDLVRGHGVDAAAERVELDELEVVRISDEFGGLVEAGVVGPLVAHAQVHRGALGGDARLGAGQVLGAHVRPVGGRLRVLLLLPAQTAADGGDCARQRPAGHLMLDAVVGLDLGLGRLGQDRVL